MNLLNKKKLFKVLSKYKFSVIIHLAANSSVSSFFKNPSKKINENVVMTSNILDLAKSMQSNIIFASSSAVYGNNNKLVSLEKDRLKPHNSYGISKVKCEKILKKYNSSIILRFFNIVGNLNKYNFNKSFFDKIENKIKKK